MGILKSRDLRIFYRRFYKYRHGRLHRLCVSTEGCRECVISTGSLFVCLDCIEFSIRYIVVAKCREYLYNGW